MRRIVWGIAALGLLFAMDARVMMAQAPKSVTRRSPDIEHPKPEKLDKNFWSSTAAVLPIERDDDEYARAAWGHAPVEYIPVPRRKPFYRDWKFMLAVGTQVAAAYADVRTTETGLGRDPFAQEKNPLVFSKRPSHGRLLVFATVETGLISWGTWYLRGDPEEYGKLWVLPTIESDAIHGIAAWHNTTIPCRLANFAICPVIHR